jgi:hypothetical protein
LLAKLTEDGHTFIADAVEHSTLVESGAEMRFTGPREFGLNIKDPMLKSAIDALLGRPVRISFTAGESTPSSPLPAAPPAASSSSDDAVTREALANPEVQRFQEMFPGSQVRTVRNLKDV